MSLENQGLMDLLDGLEISPEKIDEIFTAVNQKNILEKNSQELLSQEQSLDSMEKELRRQYLMETEWRRKSQLMAKIISLRL